MASQPTNQKLASCSMPSRDGRSFIGITLGHESISCFRGLCVQLVDGEVQSGPLLRSEVPELVLAGDIDKTTKGSTINIIKSGKRVFWEADL